jgi:NAD-dependent dihydropyrimidine dehydrogenase PreA subunit
VTIINCTIPFGVIRDISNYSKIINEILKFEISFNILKFSTDSNGANILLDVPEDKIKSITESLKENNVIVNTKGRVIVLDNCIDCGACISLCPTEALHFNDEFKLEFAYEKCIGCLLCLDSCPRSAIEEM